MMRMADWERLDDDYPEWKWMDPGEVQRRFWMYDPLTVALARLEVYRRQIVARLKLLVGWLP